MAVKEKLAEWKDEFEVLVMDPKEIYDNSKSIWEDLGYDLEEKEYKYSEKENKKTWKFIILAKKDLDEFTSVENTTKLEIEVEEIKVILPSGERKEGKKGKCTLEIKVELVKKFDEKAKNVVIGLLLKFYEHTLYRPAYERWKASIVEEANNYREKLREALFGV